MNVFKSFHQAAKEAQYAPYLLSMFVIAVWLVEFASCGSSSKPLNEKIPKADTTEVMMDVVLNKKTQDIIRVWGRKIVRDTLFEQLVDSSAGKKIYQTKWSKDSVYEAWWYVGVPDSTNKAVMKNQAGKDSVIWRWQLIDRSKKVYELYPLK